MTTYNGERFVGEQVDSILPQLHDDDELIISDDTSTDKTREILARYIDRRVRIIDSGGNLGPIRNFQHALRFAKGDVIVLSDQDDKWLAGRLDRVRDYFRRSNTQFDLLVMNSIITDGNLQPSQGDLFSYLSAGPGWLKNILRNTYVGCHLAFKRELISLATPFPAKIPMHDMWLGLVSEVVGQVTFDPEPTMLFRRSGHNWTQASYPLARRLAWRVGLVRSLIGFRVKRWIGRTGIDRATAAS
jgi:glycosyltransferase involved in cell wall biosynthesis